MGIVKYRKLWNWQQGETEENSSFEFVAEKSHHVLKLCEINNSRESAEANSFLNIKILTIITKTSKHKLNKVLWISIAIKIMLSMQERLWITSQNSLKIYIHLTNSLLYSTDHSRTLRFSFCEWPSSILDQYLLANICICALHPYSLWM